MSNTAPDRNHACHRAERTEAYFHEFDVENCIKFVPSIAFSGLALSCQLAVHKLLTTLSVKPCLVRSGIKKIAVDKTEGQNVEGQDTGN